MAKENNNKSFVLRIDAATMDALELWAADEFRSINGQLQWIIADALRRSGTDGPAVMVGDRRFDVAGAHENGLPAIGVLYGYGGREELENAGVDYLAADLHELKQLLLQE